MLKKSKLKRLPNQIKRTLMYMGIGVIITIVLSIIGLFIQKIIAITPFSPFVGIIIVCFLIVLLLVMINDAVDDYFEK